MGLLYLIIGLDVLIANKNKILNIIVSIIHDAFKIKSIYTIPIIVGFQRSIFCNEAGMGSTSMIASLSNNKDYNSESKIQLIGLYYITLVVCTISAFIILTTNYEQLDIKNINGIEIINYSFFYHFGKGGSILSSFIISMFAFSTIITSYYYGDISLKYLLGNKSINISKIIVIIVIVLSFVVNSSNIWGFVDITTALTTIINIYSLIKIRKDLRN
jgi:AGCS family alanine or glycine:cation symporter